MLPGLLIFAYIHTYAVNVPRWDEWDFVPLIRLWYEGRLTLGEVFAQYDEQRLFFPRLVMLAGVLLARHDVVLHMYGSWLLLTITGFALFLIYRRSIPGITGSLAWFLPVPWLLYSLRQRDSLLWGWQIQWYMATTFCVLAVYLLDSTNRLGVRLMLAAMSGVVASFSLSAGLLTWPAGLALLLWRIRSTEAGRRIAYACLAAAWAVVGFAVFLVYFKDYRAPHFQPPLDLYLAQPLAVLYFGVLAIGGTLSMERAHAFAFGLLLLPCFALALRSYWRARPGTGPVSGAPLALMIFVLLFLGQLIVGRSWLGADKALDSKYTPVTLLGLVGIYLTILSPRSLTNRLREAVLDGFLGLVSVGIVASALLGIDYGEDALRVRQRLAYVLANYRLQDDVNLARLGHEGADIRRYAVVLERQRLNVFSAPQPSLQGLSRLEGEAPLYVDTLNGSAAPQTAGARVDANREPMIVIKGWAIDPATGSLPNAVFVDIDGKMQIPALLGLNPGDVAQELGILAARRVGFQAEVASAEVGSGRHKASIVVVPADRAGYYVGKHTIALEVW